MPPLDGREVRGWFEAALGSAPKLAYTSLAVMVCMNKRGSLHWQYCRGREEAVVLCADSASAAGS